MARKVDKGGRRPLDPRNKRTETVPVKLSASELRECKAAAEGAGLPFSTWARDAMLLAARR